MAFTIEDVNSRTLLQQFHSLYEKQNETKQELENKQNKLTAGENITIDENNVISANSTGITVDDEISSTSENPVQNKVIYNALQSKQDVIDASHKLDADNVDDTTSTNKFVTASDKSNWNEKMSNPMTSAGDIIYGGANGDGTALPIGTAGQVLTVDSNTLKPTWANASGDKFYLHYIQSYIIVDGQALNTNFIIYSKSSSTFTRGTLSQHLYNIGVVLINPLCLSISYSSNNKIYDNVRIYGKNNGVYVYGKALYHTVDFDNKSISRIIGNETTLGDITDTVTEL